MDRRGLHKKKSKALRLTDIKESRSYFKQTTDSELLRDYLQNYETSSERWLKQTNKRRISVDWTTLSN